MATFGAARVRNVSRRARLIGLVLAALISGIYATWFAQRPLYNWDMIPYVAIALLDAGQPANTLREKTYDIIKKSTPVEPHEFLLGGSNTKKIHTSEAQTTGTWSPTIQKYSPTNCRSTP